MGLSCRGMTQAGERWMTVRWLVVLASSGTICAVVAPVFVRGWDNGR
jgi:hypothetical protein